MGVTAAYLFVIVRTPTGRRQQICRVRVPRISTARGRETTFVDGLNAVDAVITVPESLRISFRGRSTESVLGTDRDRSGDIRHLYSEPIDAATAGILPLSVRGPSAASTDQSATARHNGLTVCDGRRTVHAWCGQTGTGYGGERRHRIGGWLAGRRVTTPSVVPGRGADQLRLVTRMVRCCQPLR